MRDGNVSACRRIGVWAGRRIGVGAWRAWRTVGVLGAFLPNVVSYSRPALCLGLRTQRSDVSIILMIWARILSQASSSSSNSRRHATPFRSSSSSPDSVIPEAKFLHGFRIEEVTTVEDDRSVHRLAHTLEIDPLKFVPLSCQNKCFGVLNRFKG